VIVSLGWVTASVFGCLPYLLSGAIPSFTDAFFETMSGFTTTGATILRDIERFPDGLLYWRSLTQWIGGLGIILLSVAILPLLGVGGMQLFKAEVPGVSVEKITPRISQTARILWLVYVLLTLLETALLLWAGLPLFDAVCHSFTTVSTGGFSIKNASIAHYASPNVDIIVIVFMFLAGISFTLHYRALRGEYKAYGRDGEFKFYALLILVVTLLVFIGIPTLSSGDLGWRIRAALFQVVSIVTTTGYVTADYELWFPAVQLILLVMMLSGACAGSTAGGMKLVRVIVLLKNGLNQMKALLHPKAVIPVRHNGRAVGQEIIGDVLAFLVLYVALFAVATIVMSATGLDMVSAAGSVAATIGNIGPGLGSVGAIDNYAHIPLFGKWVLTFCMLTGRLELFTVLVLLTPSFWRS
jgi:trk system potassium uptake protein TrkH